MLYATPGKINDTIKRWGWDGAVFETFDGIVLQFVQCGETPTGILFSQGEDDYLPSSTLKFVEGEPQVDEQAKQILVMKGNFKQGVIRESRSDEYAWAVYQGNYTEEDKKRMAKYVEQFKEQLAQMY